MEKPSAGIDWATEENALCVVDAAGRRLAEAMFAHDEAGIRELVARMRDLGVERVAIERPDGLLVDRLLEAGFTVLPVHPNALKATRPRYEASGGKSDGFDAFCLAELARTDSHRLRRLSPDSDETRALRALTRTREDLVGARVRLANELRAQLDAFWPGAARVFADVDSPIGLAFLGRYPSPADAKGLGERRLEGFLSRHAYCGRRSPAELLERLRSAPEGRAGALEAEARRGAVLGLVAALRPIVDQIRELTSQIAGAVRAHPDGQVFLPLFKDPKSVITAARLVAEIGDDRTRYPTRESLAADAGMSPVARESGKRKVATFRWACDRRLRDAVATLADATRHTHPWARQVYLEARARGLEHPHAIRVLGRAWLRVLWRCWQDGVAYDPALHGNLRRLQPEGG
ncbi:MAG TPA: IS110 family transposase [Solirubrobacterales bacterium]|jgi:transposase|nr:IS110 family transposase [Solirubrobacterales bacterium]